MSDREPPQKRYVLFFSQYCAHCEQALAMLTKHNLKHAVALLSVDTHRAQLPPWVDCVPMLLDRSTQATHRGEAVFAVVDGIRGTTTEGRELDAFFGQDLRYSDCYSMLDGQDAGSAPGTFSSCYSCVDEDLRIPTPQESDPFQDKGSCKNDDMLETLMAQRDSQVRNVFGSQPLQRVG